MTRCAASLQQHRKLAIASRDLDIPVKFYPAPKAPTKSIFDGADPKKLPFEQDLFEPIDDLFINALRSSPPEATHLSVLCQEMYARSNVQLDDELPNDSAPAASKRVRCFGSKELPSWSRVALHASAVLSGQQVKTLETEDTGVVMIAWVELHPKPHVIVCSGFVIQGKERRYIVTCAHPLQETIVGDVARRGPRAHQQASGPAAGFVLTAHGDLLPIGEITGAVLDADIMLIRPGGSQALARLDSLPSLPVSPFPPPVLAEQRAHSLVTTQNQPHWLDCRVTSYRSPENLEVQPGTYDTLATMAIDAVPSSGSSGGPLVDVSMGAVTGVIRGNFLAHNERTRRGFCAPIEALGHHEQSILRESGKKPGDAQNGACGEAEADRDDSCTEPDCKSLTDKMNDIVGRATQIAYSSIDAGLIPDFILRPAVRTLSRQRIKEIERGTIQANHEAKMAFVESLRSRPIAIEQSKANEQHYEVSTEFIRSCLGPNMKYSCCYYETGKETLEEAEVAMLEQYCLKAKLEDGMDILDLGCGWGSLCLYLAKRYPNARVSALSNSSTQKLHIDAMAKERGLTNLEVHTGDVKVFDFGGMKSFDRVLSIEMLEHMKNYEFLFEKVSRWLKPNGEANGSDGSLFFAHIFCHKSQPYDFEEGDGWMAQTFFSGGTMPSLDLFAYFQKDLTLQRSWWINGTHYAKTLEAWLVKQDSGRARWLGGQGRMLDGKASEKREKEAAVTFYRFRLFFLACAEFFGLNQGEEWGVGHYVWRKVDK
ncbi:uncharacterized protein L969DRAFT_92068 [Mixia osmundae IAM 14324]|uniref:Methyltransferase domain-containing protein n=1 Tax=Mixia osmundae (strain CBS 9802 / IAM 14324 / JCM 22182 / KY 12970) TaxID=764103 RepID=G7DX94_MIXOS|nr:uncharacterized protein L969DRAFT_92068 [Mixia osmundae IAM 14324]KEI42634.1 hypothetical protein L969DRAFT_92068 [Mixia osmundae IAM 14324]GAA95204.1 hypothetical protein E5Q_01860 [Mixia osmundae IAM 14324]